jgi:hypothetical protein
MVVAECGCRWWFQAAVSPPFSSVSAFPPSLSVCASFSVSHGAGAVTNDGEDGGSWRWLWDGAGGGGKLGRVEGGRWLFFSVFSSPPVSVLLLLSLLLLFLMVAAVVGGVMVVLFCDGGFVGGGWEEQWRRWWRCNGALLLPLLSCSFTLLSPFFSFFFRFARAPLLSNKLPPSVFCSSLLLQNFAPLGFLFFLFLHPLSSLSVTALYL